MIHKKNKLLKIIIIIIKRIKINKIMKIKIQNKNKHNKIKTFIETVKI